MVVYGKRLNNALSGRGGALGKSEGCAPAVGVLARGSVAALAAFPLMLARGTAVGLVERSEKERVTWDAAGVLSTAEVEATALLGDEAANTWRAWTERRAWTESSAQAVTIGTTATATSASLMTGEKERSGILIRPLLLYISKTIFGRARETAPYLTIGQPE